MATAPMVRCPDCKQLHGGTGRCVECRRNQDAARGYSTARGYGSKHKRRSQQERARAVGQTCFMCGEPMLSGQALALDHNEQRTGYRGVVHLSCNARDGQARKPRN